MSIWWLGNNILEKHDLKKRHAAATDLCCLVLLLLLFLSSKSTDAREEAKRDNSECLLEVDYHAMSHFHSFGFCQTFWKKNDSFILMYLWIALIPLLSPVFCFSLCPHLTILVIFLTLRVKIWTCIDYKTAFSLQSYWLTKMSILYIMESEVRFAVA